jgi:hypothetical protein
MSKESMKMALEALEESLYATTDKSQFLAFEAITAIKQAFAKQEQGEPVAWIEHHKGGDNLNWEEVNHPYAKATPLYTTPQQRKPLTDEQLLQCYLKASGLEFYKSFARAIEAAHGITK